MQNKHNQTDPQWMSAAKLAGLGTGLFLIPDVTSREPQAVRKEFVQDITYRDCVLRGSLALVFKWIPNDVAIFTTLTSQVCTPDPCVDTCVEPGCACFNGMCK
jgi:hypothetical protein